MYRVAPFALAQQLVELPYLVVQALAYSCIVYWCVRAAHLLAHWLHVIHMSWHVEQAANI